MAVASSADDRNSREEGEDEAVEESQTLSVPSTPQPKHMLEEDLSLLKDTTERFFVVDEIITILFPTMSGWSEKTIFAKLSSLVAVPLVLVFTLTLPVAETDDIKVDDIEVINPMVEEIIATPQVVVISSDHEHAMDSTANNKNYLTVPNSQRSLTDLHIADEDLPILEEVSPIGWCRWLVAMQAICSTTFVTGVMARKYRGIVYIIRSF